MFEEHATLQKERKKDFCRRFCKKKGRRENPFPTHGDKIRQRQKEETRRSRWTTLSDWSFGLGQKKKKKKNDSMAFLRPYKSILQSELVRSSNNSTIPVKYQGEREGEKNFSLQPDSFYSFFPFFLSSQPFLFVDNLAGCLEIFRDVEIV